MTVSIGVELDQKGGGGVVVDDCNPAKDGQLHHLVRWIERIEPGDLNRSAEQIVKVVEKARAWGAPTIVLATDRVGKPFADQLRERTDVPVVGISYGPDDEDLEVGSLAMGTSLAAWWHENAAKPGLSEN
jgi:hypothetical protein